MLQFAQPVNTGTQQQRRVKSTKWTAQKAQEWYSHQPWLVGCNFAPSTAINQLEMWQEDTFDEPTIREELALARSLGFNVIRVYLHNLLWELDAEGFKKRIEYFLSITTDYNIRTVFVLFDDCWNHEYAPGQQPAPKPGVHNSGWVASPGRNRIINKVGWELLEGYTKDILNTFRSDDRIVMWDLYNEPGNEGLKNHSRHLLKAVFDWAWEVRPDQPLTSASWNGELKALNRFKRAHSDVITFHNYKDAATLEAEIKELLALGRPVICTEYMARTSDSFFETHLPIFRKYNVGAINWGLVAGKTNTIFPWGSQEGTPEPVVWFHDIFRKDGTPYDEKEISIIRQMTGAGN
jgi:hypothetical protein